MSRGEPGVRGARFSSCGRYRWWLERSWQPGAPRLLFIGLNPSRADGERDDPTLRRLIGFASRWGFGSLEVVNLFSRISPTPAHLARCADPVGHLTDSWIAARLRGRPVVWLGWGNQGSRQGRDARVLELLGSHGIAPQCLGCTGRGQPRHPLYLPGSLRLRPFRAS